jgi:predicted AAA+ superfamily ATPase
MMLESVIRFLMDNIGNQLSTKKISDTMTSNGRSINVRTVESYISAFMEAFIVYQAKRYDIKGKQYLKTLEKYYIVDIGLRNAMLGNTGKDVGHVLENVIYLELIRRGYDVYIGKVDDVEVDFVIKDEQGTKYIQVAASVRDENTLKRELKPLQKIQDHYPKCIMTLDRDPIADYEGIRRINALDYLTHRVVI